MTITAAAISEETTTGTARTAASVEATDLEAEAEAAEVTPGPTGATTAVSRP